MDPTVQLSLAFVFGVVFVIALLALAIVFPNPTDFQYKVFRAVLALSAAGVAAMVPGFIELQLKPTQALLVRAGGALAVFVIVYFINPAKLVSQKNASGEPSNQKTDNEQGDTQPKG